MPCGTTETGTYVPGPVTDYYSFSSEGVTDPYPGYVTYNNGTSPAYNYVQGTCLSNFHRRKNSGELLPHTFFKRMETSGFHLHGSYTETYNPGTGQWFSYTFSNRHGINGVQWWITPSELEEIANLYDQGDLVQKAAANIYTKGHDTLTFLAELGKTRDMFKNLLVRIVRKQYPKNAKDLAQAWLEWRYGWRTLIYDIQDIDDAVRSLAHKRERYTERTGTSTSWTSTTNQDFDTTSASFRVKTETSYAVSRRGSVAADISPANFMANPAITAWELMPWSFVLDWFVSVGDSLAAMSFLLLQHDYVASGGIHIEVTRRCSKWVTDMAPNWSVACNVEYLSTARYDKRTPMDIPLAPQVRLKLDDFKVSDLIAILTSKSKPVRGPRRRR